MMKGDRFENLAATGVGIDDIDFVMCTHLHVDHVGWNTRLENGRWVPTFPKAQATCSPTASWNTGPSGRRTIRGHALGTDSVLPIVAANRVDMVKSQYAFNDLVNLIPTPGHTIDHSRCRSASPAPTASSPAT